MAIVIAEASQGIKNPKQIFIKSTTGSIFRKVRINEDYEDSAAMAQMLVGKTVRNPSLWTFVKKIPTTEETAQCELDLP